MFGQFKLHNTDAESLNTHHTTQLATLVSATGAFLVAALLTSEDELIWNRKSQKVKNQTTYAGGDSNLNLLKSHLLFGLLHMGPPEKQKVCLTLWYHK